MVSSRSFPDARSAFAPDRTQTTVGAISHRRPIRPSGGVTSGRGLRYPLISATATIAGDTDDDVDHDARLRIPSSHHHVRAVEQQVPHGVKHPADADQDPTAERIGGDGEHGENGVQRECHDGTLTADNSYRERRCP